MGKKKLALFGFNDLRAVGAGITMAVICIISITANNLLIAQIGLSGSFAYLFFQPKSVSYNLKAITFHGAILTFCFILGSVESLCPFLIPVTIAILYPAFVFVEKAYQIPPPKFFFAILLFASGTGMDYSIVVDVFGNAIYLFWGCGVSILVGLFISLAMKLPWKEGQQITLKLNVSEHYKELCKADPIFLLRIVFYAMILFFAASISVLINGNNGHWILVSSAAILLGYDFSTVLKRGVHRVWGSTVGMFVGLLLMVLHLNIYTRMFLLAFLNILIEHYVSKNYALTNVFTTAQVLLLYSLTEGQISVDTIFSRISCVVIGAAITLILISVFRLCLRKADIIQE